MVDVVGIVEVVVVDDVVVVVVVDGGVDDVVVPAGSFFTTTFRLLRLNSVALIIPEEEKDLSSISGDCGMVKKVSLATGYALPPFTEMLLLTVIERVSLLAGLARGTEATLNRVAGLRRMRQSCSMGTPCGTLNLGGFTASMYS